MKKIEKIFSEVLEIDSIDSNSSLNNTENWDSLNHLILISRIEDEFQITFTPEEIENLNSFEKILKKVIRETDVK